MCASAEQKSREADAKVALAKAEQELAACEKQVQEEVEHQKRAAACTKDQKYNRVTKQCDISCPDGHAVSLDGKCVELKQTTPSPDLAEAAPTPEPAPVAPPVPRQAAPQKTIAPKAKTYTVKCDNDKNDFGPFTTRSWAGSIAARRANETGGECHVFEHTPTDNGDDIREVWLAKPKTTKKTDSPPTEKAQAPTTAPPAATKQINHEPLVSVPKGEPTRIDVTTVGFKATEAFLYYRSKSGDKFKAMVVPGHAIKGEGNIFWKIQKVDGPFEYYVAVYFGKEVFYSGSAEKPYSVKVEESNSEDYLLYCAKSNNSPRAPVKAWPKDKKPNQKEMDEAGKGLFNCELYKGDTNVTEADKEAAAKKDGQKKTEKTKDEPWNKRHLLETESKGPVKVYLFTRLQFQPFGHTLNLYNPVVEVEIPGLGFVFWSNSRIRLHLEFALNWPGSKWCCNSAEFSWGTGLGMKLTDRWELIAMFNAQHRYGTTQFTSPGPNSRTVELTPTNELGLRAEVAYRATRWMAPFVGVRAADRGVGGANKLAAPSGADLLIEAGLRLHLN
jgi:hypothetical protein